MGNSCVCMLLDLNLIIVKYSCFTAILSLLSYIQNTVYIYIYIYIYIYSTGEESHDRGESVMPGGWVYWGFLDVNFSLSWVGDRCSPEDLCSCSPVLSSVPWSCFPVAVLRAVLVCGGWPVKRCFLEYNADSELAWSLLETCLTTSVCVAAAYQALPWRASGARPALDEDVQVILVGFQATGNDGKCVPVAQWLEHCVSSAKVVGSIPREHTYWQYNVIAWMHWM